MSGILIFSLIVNLLFSTFAYAFTQFPNDENTDFEISISKEKLTEYGITFTNATSMNITFSQDPVYFSYNDINYRVQWVDSALDYIVFQRRSFLGESLDNWFFNYDLSIKLVESGFVTDFLPNSSIINYWEPQEGWLRMIIDNSIDGILTTIPPDSGNITKAVYETGILTLTVGQVQQDTYSFDAFIDWYSKTILSGGFDGMPAQIQWILRGWLALNIVIFIFAIKDLTKL